MWPAAQAGAGALLATGSLTAIACGGGRLLARLDPAGAVPLALWQLLALAALGVAGAGAAAIGFAPVPVPPSLEAMAPQPTLTAIFAALAAAGAAVVACERLGRGTAGGPRALPPWPRAARLPLALHDALLVALWPLTLLPPHLVDETAYHLALPIHVLVTGGWQPVPGHGNNGFPALAEFVGLWPLAAGSLAGARAVQGLAVWLGARAAVALWPAPGQVAAAWGALLFVLVPSVLRILPTSHVDVAAAVYAGVGVLCLGRAAATLAGSRLLPARRAAAPAPAAVVQAFAGAAAAGAAAACKAHALWLLPFAALMISLPLRRHRAAGGASLRGLALAVPAACAVPLPFYVHALVVYGNPLFPFALDLFPASAAALWPSQRETLAAFMRQFGPLDRRGAPLFGVAALARLPWAPWLAARFDTVAFDGVLGLTPPLLLATLWAGRRSARAALPPAWLAYLGLTAVVWLSTSWQARLLLGGMWATSLALPAVLAALPVWPRRAGTVAAVVVVALGVLPAVARLPPWDRRMWGTPAARLALRHERLPESAVCEALATSDGPAPPRAMLVWTQRQAAFCTALGHSDSYDEAATLEALLAAGAPAAARALSARGLTHLVVAEDDAFARPPAISAREAAARDRTDEALRALLHEHARLIARRGATALYAVAPSPRGGRGQKVPRGP